MGTGDWIAAVGVGVGAPGALVGTAVALRRYLTRRRNRRDHLVMLTAMLPRINLLCDVVLGTDERKDGDRVIVPGHMGIANAPILNGGGERVIADVAALKKWTIDHSGLHDALERIPRQVQAE